MKLTNILEKYWYFITIILATLIVITTHRAMDGSKSPNLASTQPELPLSKIESTPENSSKVVNVSTEVEKSEALKPKQISTITSNKSSKLGHLNYQEADKEDLVTIASYAQGKYQRYEQLHKDAALALMKMIYAARDNRVWIVPVSGYRDVEKQHHLFQAQIRRKGSEKEAAKSSAPPGYSEHHTGYTIDLTDGKLVNRDITSDFASTDAYQWLVGNAHQFGFELSFPKNNSQGVNYEPWHWRYIGSQEALKTFADARNVK